MSIHCAYVYMWYSQETTEKLANAGFMPLCFFITILLLCYYHQRRHQFCELVISNMSRIRTVIIYYSYYYFQTSTFEHSWVNIKPFCGFLMFYIILHVALRSCSFHSLPLLLLSLALAVGWMWSGIENRSCWLVDVPRHNHNIRDNSNSQLTIGINLLPAFSPQFRLTVISHTTGSPWDCFHWKFARKHKENIARVLRKCVALFCFSGWSRLGAIAISKSIYYFGHSCFSHWQCNAMQCNEWRRRKWTKRMSFRLIALSSLLLSLSSWSALATRLNVLLYIRNYTGCSVAPAWRKLSTDWMWSLLPFSGKSVSFVL